MNLTLSQDADKASIFEQIAAALAEDNFTVVKQDQTRPWGGFFVIDETQAPAFAAKYFPHLEMSEIQITNKLSPKILVVAPEKRLSWQYHFRRAEIWKVIAGTTVGVKISDTDEESDEVKVLESGSFIQMDTGERHRLIGLDGWGIVAEIWQHTDPENPSDEEDIVRLQDDFGR
ncbi:MULTISPECIES: phosphoheptose isomerase [unclassified Arcicella]|uniref:phosphoheptose isomerase n=1 Tax=unclassified Arcicella TaxID=2644986 RepID=UPI00285FA7D2|nr:MULTISPECIES: phosphoheptose isomerase [unclassified Arcicella]MDR6563356.1 mannose-6-phosphate isomerase-like protein (cupin superfamily) [Arcicella sp. BE51]MDR6813223.1 mannose-6-phosphate isomerase-like protein (cupin superfamily) [Arcicella sp. BE140]MDR6824537.1 mannose-6-phosphate isomerase-like protein (cupin superfamily) [Arcicella sp. BE139]